MSIKITKDKVADVVSAIKRLTSQEILVGIPKGIEHDSPDGGEPIDSASLGYIHEFGAPNANIPARPFLLPGVRKALKEGLTDKLKKTAKTALDGDIAKIEMQLNAIGAIARDAVMQKIVDGPFQPLAARTLAARRLRGVTRTAPLLDTGAMRQSLTYIVDKRKR